MDAIGNVNMNFSKALLNQVFSENMVDYQYNTMWSAWYITDSNEVLIVSPNKEKFYFTSKQDDSKTELGSEKDIEVIQTEETEEVIKDETVKENKVLFDLESLNYEGNIIEMPKDINELAMHFRKSMENSFDQQYKIDKMIEYIDNKVVPAIRWTQSMALSRGLNVPKEFDFGSDYFKIDEKDLNKYAVGFSETPLSLD